MQNRLKNAPKPVCEAKEKAWKRFCAAKPCRMMNRLIAASNFMKLSPREEWAGTDVPAGYEQSFLPIVNGYWSRLSSRLEAIPELSIVPICQGYQHSGVLHIPENENDCFALLAHAAYQEGLVLIVPANRKVKMPLYILHDLTKPLWAISRLHIILGKNASLQITESTTSSPSAVLNSLVTMEIGEGGTLIFQHNAYASATSSFSMRAFLQKNSSLTFSQTVSSVSSRHSSTVSLDENAFVSMKGLSLLPSYNESLVQTHINHIGARSRSLQEWRGVVADDGYASHSLTAVLRACDSESEQHSRFLTLGGKAHVRHEPRFEIFHDTVKASHGATTATIDQDSMYYMKSRGIPEREAKAFCVAGFCQGLFPQMSPQAAAIIGNLV